MPDPAHNPEFDTTASRVPTTSGSPPPTAPRWVKVCGIILVVLALVFAAMALFGNHGPSRHTSSGGLGGPAPLPSATTVLASSSGGLGSTPTGEGDHG